MIGVDRCNKHADSEVCYNILDLDASNNHILFWSINNRRLLNGSHAELVISLIKLLVDLHIGLSTSRVCMIL